MQDRPRIVQLVGGGDKPGRGGRRFQVRDVFLLSLPPGRFWRLIRVGAASHDLANFLPEYLFDLALPRRAAAILHRIVQQSANRLRFVCAVFHRNRRHSQKMTDVRNLVFLAQLAAVDARRVDERLSNFGESVTGYRYADYPDVTDVERVFPPQSMDLADACPGPPR